MSSPTFDPDDALHFFRSQPSQRQAEKNEKELFHYRSHVGRAHDLYLREAVLVYEALRPLIASLESGCLTEPMRRLLADFLISIIEKGDYRLGLRVLGLPEQSKAGAPKKDKDVLWWEAHSNYEHWIEQGHSDEEALRVAWETFYPDKCYEEESIRPAGENTTAYAQQIEKLKWMLNKRGSRVPPPKGRKPNKSPP